MSRPRTVAVCLVILLAAVGLTAAIYSTEPTATRTSATRSTAMLVDVTRAQRGSYTPEIVTMGTVQPAREINLSPRVGGEIVERSGGFEPGGFIAAGALLLRIDDADYRNVLQQRRADLRQAEADLALELGRQNVARQDFEFLADTLSSTNEDLVLRRPQLNAARARVEAARGAVNQAELDLARTRIYAPFRGHILSRRVDVGSQVSPGQDLGRLVGLDTFWVAATVPQDKLRWLAVPYAPGEIGSPVQVRNRNAWPEGAVREGRVHRLIGALSEATRMAQVLVAVPDPMARGAGGQLPVLIVGAFVEARIEGRPIDGVIRLARDHVRQGETVWVYDDGTLRVRPVKILFQDAAYAYIAGGLEDGDRVVTTNLSTVIDGAELRLAGAPGS